MASIVQIISAFIMGLLLKKSLSVGMMGAVVGIVDDVDASSFDEEGSMSVWLDEIDCGDSSGSLIEMLVGGSLVEMPCWEDAEVFALMFFITETMFILWTFFFSWFTFLSFIYHILIVLT